MDKIKIGVLCPSEIAFRRFMPALGKLDQFKYAGIAAAAKGEWSGDNSDEIISGERKKAEKFVSEYGGKIFNGYLNMISSDEIDSVYIPLPPALHYKWGKLALENGKHVLIEKPFTASSNDTKTLIKIARNNDLAVHENYMFVFHSQLDFIRDQIDKGTIGDIRLIRADFGFPFRGANDFRYNKKLGGGALLDCGGYALKLVSLLIGNTAKITASKLNFKEKFETDIFGSATLENADGLTAQISFGMDNDYRCSLDVWGSTGSIRTNRIFTAPIDFEPAVIIKNAEGEKVVNLPTDDTFKKSIEKFELCINDTAIRESNCQDIIRQSELVDQIKGD